MRIDLLGFLLVVYILWRRETNIDNDSERRTMNVERKIVDSTQQRNTGNKIEIECFFGGYFLFASFLLGERTGASRINCLRYKEYFHRMRPPFIDDGPQLNWLLSPQSVFFVAAVVGRHASGCILPKA